MDVIGRRPGSKTGEHFRNNTWWWHPLWEYCRHVAPGVCDGVLGHTNDGDGLPADGARRLAGALRTELACGRTRVHAEKHRAATDALPRLPCTHCRASGIRADMVGRDAGMPKRPLDPERAARLGRAHGWCNACDGEGTVAHWDAAYSFDEDNVRRFADFLDACGGFRIH